MTRRPERLLFGWTSTRNQKFRKRTKRELQRDAQRRLFVEQLEDRRMLAYVGPGWPPPGGASASFAGAIGDGGGATLSVTGLSAANVVAQDFQWGDLCVCRIESGYRRYGFQSSWWCGCLAGRQRACHAGSLCFL